MTATFNCSWRGIAQKSSLSAKVLFVGIVLLFRVRESIAPPVAPDPVGINAMGGRVKQCLDQISIAGVIDNGETFNYQYGGEGGVEVEAEVIDLNEYYVSRVTQYAGNSQCWRYAGGSVEFTITNKFEPGDTSIIQITGSSSDARAYPIFDAQVEDPCRVIGLETIQKEVRGSHERTEISALVLTGDGCSPTKYPTRTPTSIPSSAPTAAPTTFVPSPVPTQNPTFIPSPLPTQNPTFIPSPLPTQRPTFIPSPLPTQNPTFIPSPLPTQNPTFIPSPVPTQNPTFIPSPSPTQIPTLMPSPVPTQNNVIFSFNTFYSDDRTPYTPCDLATEWECHNAANIESKAIDGFSTTPVLSVSGVGTYMRYVNSVISSTSPEDIVIRTMVYKSVECANHFFYFTIYDNEDFPGWSTSSSATMSNTLSIGWDCDELKVLGPGDLLSSIACADFETYAIEIRLSASTISVFALATTSQNEYIIEHAKGLDDIFNGSPFLFHFGADLDPSDPSSSAEFLSLRLAGEAETFIPTFAPSSYKECAYIVDGSPTYDSSDYCPDTVDDESIDDVLTASKSDDTRAGVRCCNMDGTGTGSSECTELCETVTYFEAEARCEANGNRRLCTRDELITALNTGCHYNYMHVWVSDPIVCTPTGSPVPVPTAVPTVLPTTSPSTIPSFCPTHGPSSSPSLVPTLDNVVIYFENFVYATDDDIVRRTPCENVDAWDCYDEDEILLYDVNQLGIDGFGNYLRFKESVFSSLSDDDIVVRSSLLKDHECNNHFFYVSTSVNQDFTDWSKTPGVFMIGWDCGDLRIVGPTDEIIFTNCDKFATYDIEIRLSPSKISMNAVGVDADEACYLELNSIGLELFNGLPLYFHFGADMDPDEDWYSEFFSLRVSGRTTTPLPTTTPSSLPTMTPTAMPTKVPSPQPTPAPTLLPLMHPTVIPTSLPSQTPSVLPSAAPTFLPTHAPSSNPSAFPTVVPVNAPTAQPSARPTMIPSETPTDAPSSQPVSSPTRVPSTSPTGFPSIAPSQRPSAVPSTAPTSLPTNIPTSNPSADPTMIPVHAPTAQPSTHPTIIPTKIPTSSPTNMPTSVPSANPTMVPIREPTAQPSTHPTIIPTKIPTSSPTNIPTSVPSADPTMIPVHAPTAQPSTHPTMIPTKIPTSSPTNMPTSVPSANPTMIPIREPTAQPSTHPTVIPTKIPTSSPTHLPSIAPSADPTIMPMDAPTAQPSTPPTRLPTNTPSDVPTLQPITIPTEVPSFLPTWAPSIEPTEIPSMIPTQSPTKRPTQIPTNQPTATPTFIPSPSPSFSPSGFPTKVPIAVPSAMPTVKASYITTRIPISSPTPCPTPAPSTDEPTLKPSSARPTIDPTSAPTTLLPTTIEPTTAPPTNGQTTLVPTSPEAEDTGNIENPLDRTPSSLPSSQLSAAEPSEGPSTLSPSLYPSEVPVPQPTTPISTSNPSMLPTSRKPTLTPSMVPTSLKPSRLPSKAPSATSPSSEPSSVVASLPTTMEPSPEPISSPTIASSSIPTLKPWATSTLPTSMQPSTAKPTSSPSILPSTSNPSTNPSTSSPSFAPSTLRPTILPSSMPSVPPSRTPTQAPSASSASGTVRLVSSDDGEASNDVSQLAIGETVSFEMQVYSVARRNITLVVDLCLADDATTSTPCGEIIVEALEEFSVLLDRGETTFSFDLVVPTPKYLGHMYLFVIYVKGQSQRRRLIDHKVDMRLNLGRDLATLELATSAFFIEVPSENEALLTRAPTWHPSMEPTTLLPPLDSALLSIPTLKPTDWPTTTSPTTKSPTSDFPSVNPTTAVPSLEPTSIPTFYPTISMVPTATKAPTPLPSVSVSPTTPEPTTLSPTTFIPTTSPPTTSRPTTLSPTGAAKATKPTPEAPTAMPSTLIPSPIPTLELELLSSSKSSDDGSIGNAKGCFVLVGILCGSILILLAAVAQERHKAKHAFRISFFMYIFLVVVIADVGADAIFVCLRRVAKEYGFAWLGLIFIVVRVAFSMYAQLDLFIPDKDETVNSTCIRTAYDLRDSRFSTVVDWGGLFKGNLIFSCVLYASPAISSWLIIALPWHNNATTQRLFGFPAYELFVRNIRIIAITAGAQGMLKVFCLFTKAPSDYYVWISLCLNFQVFLISALALIHVYRVAHDKRPSTTKRKSKADGLDVLFAEVSTRKIKAGRSSTKREQEVKEEGSLPVLNEEDEEEIWPEVTLGFGETTKVDILSSVSPEDKADENHDVHRRKSGLLKINFSKKSRELFTAINGSDKSDGETSDGDDDGYVPAHGLIKFDSFDAISFSDCDSPRATAVITSDTSIKAHSTLPDQEFRDEEMHFSHPTQHISPTQSAKIYVGDTTLASTLFENEHHSEEY